MEKIYEKRGSKWNNEYFDNGDDIIIKISKEESKEIYDILIDKEDFDKVKEGQWYVGIKRKNTHLKEIPSILPVINTSSSSILDITKLVPIIIYLLSK